MLFLMFSIVYPALARFGLEPGGVQIQLIWLDIKQEQSFEFIRDLWL